MGDRLVAKERPGYGTRLTDFTFRDSRNVLGRLLHYYAVSEPVGNWCGWHNDNSTITGLVPALWFDEDSGLPAQAPEGARLCRDTFAMFIQPMWDAAISPPDAVDYEAIFVGREESHLIPPLRRRLPKVPVEFGQLLGDSFAEYYAM